MRKGIAVLIVLFGIAGSAGEALATKKVYSPHVEAGEWEIEARGGFEFDDPKKDKQKYKTAVGYGVNEAWFTEIYGVWQDKAGADAEFSGFEWENKLQLTEPGMYWVDFGVLLEYVFGAGGHDDKIEGKLLFQKDTGAFTHMLNLILESEISDGDDHLEEGFAWGTRYRHSPAFEPGIEIHSGEEDHRIGPVVYGQLGPNLHYDVGYLFGVSEDAPDGTLKLIVEYGWRF